MITILPVIASTTTPAGDDLEHLLGEGLELMIVGMSVVFVALVLVGVTMVLLRLVAGDKQPSAKTATAAGGAATAASSQAEPPITPELIAVLAAAATVAVGRPARVSRVRFVSYTPGHAWTERGRATAQSSYPVRKSIR